VEERIEGVVRDMSGVMAGTAMCHYERIRSGLPAVSIDLGPRSLPHEGRLEDSAVSYTKGCYTGQEVMARLRNRGRARRCLVPAEFKGEPPELPCPVYHGEKEVGRMTSLGRFEGEQIVFVLALRSLLSETDSLSLQPSVAGKSCIRIMDLPGGNEG